MERKNMDLQREKTRLLELVALSADYCFVCENVSEYNKEELIDRMLDLLPRIYWNFFDLQTEQIFIEEFYPEYVDEDYYESIRRHIESIMGEDDIFLETFEEDMKYSETPIGASIAESLSDIFQPLFNFVNSVKEADGENIFEMFSHCKDEFISYWSQKLCNVLRALNSIKYSQNNLY